MGIAGNTGEKQKNKKKNLLLSKAKKTIFCVWKLAGYIENSTFTERQTVILWQQINIITVSNY